MNLRLGYLFCRNSIIPKPYGFMLFYCQLLLNFQGSYIDFYVRSFSNLNYIKQNLLNFDTPTAKSMGFLGD